MGVLLVIAVVASVVLLSIGVVRRRERQVTKIFVGAALVSAALLALGMLRHQETIGGIATAGLVISLIALASLAQWRAKQARWHREMMEEDDSEAPDHDA